MKKNKTIKHQFKSWFKKTIKLPPSNFTQKLSVWAAIVTGVCGLFVSILALSISEQQAEDHKQLDTLSALVTKTNKQIDAINMLNRLTINQNTKMDSQSKILLEQSKALVEQVKYTMEILKMNQNKSISESKLDSTHLKNDLEYLFNYLKMSCKIFEGVLLKAKIDSSDIKKVAEFYNIVGRNYMILNYGNANTVIVSNESNKNQWNKYEDLLYNLGQNNYLAKVNEKVSYPLFEEKLENRILFFKDYKKASLKFLDQFSTMFKKDPLKAKELREMLK